MQPVETAANSFHLSCLEDAKNACTYCNTNRHKRKHFAKQTFQNCPCENQTLCLRKRRKVTLYSRKCGPFSPAAGLGAQKSPPPRTGASSFAHEARIPPVRYAPTAAKENSRRRSGAHPISTDNKKKKDFTQKSFRSSCNHIVTLLKSFCKGFCESFCNFFVILFSGVLSRFAGKFQIALKGYVLVPAADGA